MYGGRPHTNAVPVCRRPLAFSEGAKAVRPRCKVSAKLIASCSPERCRAHAEDCGIASSRLPLQRWQQLARQAARAAAVLGASAAVWLTAVPELPASAITAEQLLYLEAWRAVDRAYVDKTFNGHPWFKVREDALKKAPMEDRAETYEAIRASLRLLDDPFTRFLDPDRYAALKRGNAGTVTGVGLEVGFSNESGRNRMVVVTPAAGGPAEGAGIRPQDAILAIGDKSTEGVSLFEAAALLQGAEGTEVSMTVQPRGSDATRQLALTRRKVKFNPVTSRLCGGSPRTAYLRVSTFSKQTAEGVGAALQALKDQGAERYILDVRNNGGGSFPAGIQVARMWLDSGDLVLIADSNGVRDVYEADGTAAEPKAPLAVLVNRGTASASEVLAGALKDNKRALVAGERTFGKGLIQTVVELSDGSAVAVTVSRYQTPAGTDINKVGIAPDVEVPDGELPLADAEGLCKVVQGPSAPPLFR